MELLRDFEETISRLIENQEMLNLIFSKETFSFEKEALLKTIESLKAHVHFLTDIYPKEKRLIKGSYSKKQFLIQKINYLKEISDIQLQVPFESKVFLRKHRFKKISTL